MGQGNPQVRSHLNMKDSLQTALPARGNASYPVRQEFSPKQIIESLPDSATPAQQDSAVQAMLPPRPTVRSERPDTLNLPGWKVPSSKAVLSAQDIRWYDENYFSSSPYYHAEVSIRPTGMDAEPLPYILCNDDWVTGILLCCFLVLMTVFANDKTYVKQRLRDFFLNRTEKEKLFPMEADCKTRRAFFLYLQNGLLTGLFFFDYTQASRDLFMPPVPLYVLLGVYAVVCWVYLGLKQLSYLFVNWIFFDKERRTFWMKSYSFLVSAEGALLFPLALAAVFFSLQIRDVILCLCLLWGFVRVLLFYKTFCIFFPKFYGFLHLIVYFCTLEMLPICGLWRALTYTNDILLQNY